MIQFLENKIYELIGLGIFIILGIFHFLTGLAGTISGIMLTVIGIYYLIRLAVSFRHWKISKGASLINAHINFMLFAAILGIGFTLQYLPGNSEMIYVCLVIPQYTIVLFGIVMLIKRQKFSVYWELIRVNVISWLISIAICLILFYTLDMSTYLIEHESPSEGWIKLY